MVQARRATGKSGGNGQAPRAGKLEDAAVADDDRAFYDALLRDLTKAFAQAPASAQASIANQIRAARKERGLLPKAKKVSTADDLAARRKARRAAAAASAQTAGSEAGG